MTYLKDYALSAITLNMGLSAMMMAGAIIFMGFEENGFGQFEVDLPLLINSAFCAAAGMITFGAVIGFASPVQALWLLAFEVPLYAANVYLTVYKIGAFDVGGSITIHAFGAFFGLAASTFITRSSKTLGSQHHKNASSPASDLTSMIGTLFLWVYWPSFNAALASSGPDVETQAHHQFVSLIGRAAISTPKIHRHSTWSPTPSSPSSAPPWPPSSPPPSSKAGFAWSTFKTQPLPAASQLGLPLRCAFPRLRPWGLGSSRAPCPLSASSTPPPSSSARSASLIHLVCRWEDSWRCFAPILTPL